MIIELSKEKAVLHLPDVILVHFGKECPGSEAKLETERFQCFCFNLLFLFHMFSSFSAVSKSFNEFQMKFLGPEAINVAPS